MSTRHDERLGGWVGVRENWGWRRSCGGGGGVWVYVCV